jgi:inorganic triphosphatase YgiF
MAEIELKLTAPAARLDALRAALARLAGGRIPAPRTLNAVYYDTRKRDLARAGFTLRVRREDGSIVQTLKAAGSDLLTRGEWSDRLSGDSPDLTAKASGRRARRIVRGALQPQFRIDVRRSVFDLRVARTARIEAAVDEGTIRPLGRRRVGERIAEVELELKSGDRAALYLVAMRLLAVAPLSIETRAKSARGFAMIRAAAAKAEKVAALPLDRDMTVDDVLREAGSHYLTQYLRNVPAAMNENVEAIHQMRVALRRLRAALRAFKDDLSAAAHDWANERLKRLLQSLGPARNWDVFVIEMIAPLDKRQRISANTALQRAATAARLRAHAQAREALTSPAHTATVLELLRWFDSRGWRAQGAKNRLATSLAVHAGKIVARQFRRTRKRGRGFARLREAERHEFRIALKALRYTVELLQPVLDAKAAKRFLRTLKPLQDKLGHLNDIATAKALLSELTRQNASPGLALRGGVVLGWYERRAAAEDSKLCRQVEAFCKTKRFW